jgi:hypothetical protein
LDQRNVLLTGLPRSGTTLACELLGSLPDTVALDEPLDGPALAAPAGAAGRLSRWFRRPVDPARPSPAAVMDRIDHFVADTRRSLIERGVARTKVVNGRVQGRKVSDEVDEAGVRIKLVSVGEIRTDKPLSNDFLLVVKHNSSFTALLPALADRFRVHALVRNPLSVLGSWQGVPFPIRDGRVPLAERLNAALATSLDAIDDPLDRQFYLLEWFFEMFTGALQRDAVTRYEDVVATGGRCLSRVTDRANALAEALENRNSSRVYEAGRVRELGLRLLGTDGPWWELYTREDVEAVMAGDG